jgi:homogentisate 1,2-dioxygenase
MTEPVETTFQNSTTHESSSFEYQTGFDNTFESEAVIGALPKGRNNPRIVPHGLYAEQLSGTAFTCTRSGNRRSWLYRQQPSVVHNSQRFVDSQLFFGGEDPTLGILDPNPLRWKPFTDDDDDDDCVGEEEKEGNNDKLEENTTTTTTTTTTTANNNNSKEKNFVTGMHLLGSSGDPSTKHGLAIYVYLFQSSMDDCHLYNSDGDLLLVPQQGSLTIYTELGRLTVAVGEIGVIPRGIIFSVHTMSTSPPETSTTPSETTKTTTTNRGYVLEIYKGHFTIPELGPIGSNGLANARDFCYPVAWYENHHPPTTTRTLYNKFGSRLWTKSIASTPYNVVAWHGNYLPFKYNLHDFCAVNSVSYDHLDPSIYTVLTCAGGDEPVGTALCDFVIFPPRWMSTDSNTFRPPWFHRNTMTEFMGLIYGAYDAKAGFQAGGASLHSCMTPHGPDSISYAKAVADPCDVPTKFDGGLAFMFETSCMLRVSHYALQHSCLDVSYGDCWADLPNEFEKRKARMEGAVANDVEGASGT